MMTISRFIRTFRFIALIIAASWLAGCSAIKLAYNQAPTLAYGWLDGYLDFNDQQSPQVRDALNRLFAWHRASELPKTADQRPAGLPTLRSSPWLDGLHHRPSLTPPG
jgi:hypothetical protein